MRTRVLPSQLRSSWMQKLAYEHARIWSHWHSCSSLAYIQKGADSSRTCLLPHLPFSSYDLHWHRHRECPPTQHSVRLCLLLMWVMPAPRSSEPCQQQWELNRILLPTNKYFGIYVFPHHYKNRITRLIAWNKSYSHRLGLERTLETIHGQGGSDASH